MYDNEYFEQLIKFQMNQYSARTKYDINYIFEKLKSQQKEIDMLKVELNKFKSSDTDNKKSIEELI